MTKKDRKRNETKRSPQPLTCVLSGLQPFVIIIFCVVMQSRLLCTRQAQLALESPKRLPLAGFNDVDPARFAIS